MDKSYVEKCENWLIEIQDHLRDQLIPFWNTRGDDTEFGGFLTYYDPSGMPTGEDVKTLVGQTQMIYAFASLHRAGLDPGNKLIRAQRGAEFLFEHFWDPDHGGWYTSTSREGEALDSTKNTYGHAMAVYALSEYAMASGDLRATDWAVRSCETLQTFSADNLYGGYSEHFQKDWTPTASKKTFRTHVLLFEAFTNMFEALGAPFYKRKAQELMDLIRLRMIHPKHGTGFSKLTADWRPDPDDGTTCYGENFHYAWTLRHALNLFGEDRDDFDAGIRALCAHAADHGIDRDHGGVFNAGPHQGPASNTDKEAWAQGEAMVALLDAYIESKEPRALQGYESIHRFVMDLMVDKGLGEWRPLFDANNQPLGDERIVTPDKTNYHTFRAMLQCEARLIKISLARKAFG